MNIVAILGLIFAVVVFFSFIRIFSVAFLLHCLKEAGAENWTEEEKTTFLQNLALGSYPWQP